MLAERFDMPIYEFSCAKCGGEFEDLVYGNETPPCPACGSHDTQKLMSASARRSRGDGADYSMPATGGGCSGCSGGNCASCGR